MDSVTLGYLEGCRLGTAGLVSQYQTAPTSVGSRVLQYSSSGTGFFGDSLVLTD